MNLKVQTPCLPSEQINSGVQIIIHRWLVKMVNPACAVFLGSNCESLEEEHPVFCYCDFYTLRYGQLLLTREILLTSL